MISDFGSAISGYASQLFHEPVQKMGFIHYNGGLQVHSSLLNVVLHDWAAGVRPLTTVQIQEPPGPARDEQESSSGGLKSHPRRPDF
jgi:hypothetical protein